MLELSRDLTVDLAGSDARHGFGLFETCRIQDGRVRWLDLHLARMAAGCRLLGLPHLPEQAQVAAFLASHLDLPMAGGLRLIAVDGRLGVQVDAAPPPLAGPATLAVAMSLRRLAGAPGTRAKLLSYADNRLLHAEAAQRGLFEVIALNEAGRLTDGGRTTLLVVRDGEVLTPPTTDGALPGIARRVLLEAGCVKEASLTPEDLAQAEGLMLVNALRGGIAVKEDPQGKLARCAEHLG